MVAESKEPKAKEGKITEDKTQKQQEAVESEEIEKKPEAEAKKTVSKGKSGPKAKDSADKKEEIDPNKVDQNKLHMASPKKQSFRKRHVAKGEVHILCTYNNTLITMTDLNGGVLGWSSSGSLGFKGSKKSTPYAATLVAQKVIEKTARFGVKDVDIFVKGVGGGREASIRAIGNAGLQINIIKDITPVPHNGCRPKKPRRV